MSVAPRNRWPTIVRAIQSFDQIMDEAKIDRGINLTQQVIAGNQALKRDHLRLGLVGCGSFQYAVVE